MKTSFFILILFVLTLAGCNTSTVFNKTESFDLAWDAKHIVSLTTDTINKGKYEEILVYRYGDGYPFSQLKIHLVTTNKETTFNDSDFMIDIIDKAGNYIGDGLGDIWDLEQPLDTITINKPTALEFQISQKVINGNLPMVMEVGIKLKKLAE